jgi:hypothetical protein
MARLTFIPVLLSLVSLGSGLLLISAFLTGRRTHRLNGIFLIMAAGTSVTGFFFPFHGVTPGIVVGLVSLSVLILATIALARKWSRVYMTSAVTAQCLNVLVLITQVFAKFPALHRAAPNGNEPVVGATQGLALLVFLTIAVKAVRRSLYRLCWKRRTSEPSLAVFAHR